jgi:hypothetical protein
VLLGLETVISIRNDGEPYRISVLLSEVTELLADFVVEEGQCLACRLIRWPVDGRRTRPRYCSPDEYRCCTRSSQRRLTY